MYTRVLLGTLGLERIVWPKGRGISGGDMDILARQNLWAAGLDYCHGTGHGIGSYSYCHEGPYGIGRGYKMEFTEGMVVSDEPGFYKDGEFGIRIENAIMVVQHPQHEKSWMWENLTVAPYARQLIDKSLLSPADIQFIDEFHVKCLAELSPLLQEDQRAMDYLRRACEPL